MLFATKKAKPKSSRWHDAKHRPTFTLADDEAYQQLVEHLNKLKGELARADNQLNTYLQDHRTHPKRRLDDEADALTRGEAVAALRPVPTSEQVENARHQRDLYRLAVAKQQALVDAEQQRAAQRVVEANNLRDEYQALLQTLYHAAVEFSAAQAECIAFQDMLHCSGIGSSYVPNANLPRPLGDENDPSSILSQWLKNCEDQGYSIR